ncbi:hypothetical protein [Rathayibacter sp. AY1H3]|uniref:hypothetical protein n=1 Tax=Rathayibacter sp. AY1H3 TaxID=2080567 RepID=UPI002157232E|nr:hypothetical protein [Rathayibacter sp. AY1H3]
MPVVTVLPDRLELRLTAAERLLAFHRSDVVVDRSSIRSATVTEDPWIWVRGIRAPGTAVPLTLAAGTWKFHGGKDFLLIKRTASAVVIDLVDEDYSRLIVSTKHAPELIAALQLGTTTAAIPVIETDDLVIVPEVAEQAERAQAAAAEKRAKTKAKAAEAAAVAAEAAGPATVVEGREAASGGSAAAAAPEADGAAEDVAAPTESATGAAPKSPKATPKAARKTSARTAASTPAGSGGSAPVDVIGSEPIESAAPVKPAEPKPAEPKPAGSKPAEPKPAGSKPAEPKPAGSESAEPAPAKPGPAAKPAPKPRTPAKPRAARPDSSVGHASAEPSGATEAAE